MLTDKTFRLKLFHDLMFVIWAKTMSKNTKIPVVGRFRRPVVPTILFTSYGS